MAPCKEDHGRKKNKRKTSSNSNSKTKLRGGTFESFGLSQEVYRGIKRKGYQFPTPIQRKTIPCILAGHDVVAMARTGSGKTAAFLVPMIEKLRSHIASGPVRALVLSPTRDLALQTLKFARELARYTDLRTCLIVGGDKLYDQFEELAQNPDITPGRLVDNLAMVKDLSLRSVEYLVFDEADSLFEMGFAEQLHGILTHLSENRQTLLFSATLPSVLADFAKAGLQDPHLTRLDVETKISPELKMDFFTLSKDEKCAALLYLVREHISSDQQTMIFVSTRYHAEFLNLLFKEEGMDSSIGYSEMDPTARKIHASRFRSRATMLYIVTDVAARGLDIPLVDYVINYDFPPKPKNFVHRVGRVARAGRVGTAYLFVTPEDMPYLLDLHLFLSRPIMAAPTEKKVLQDMNGVQARLDQMFADGGTVYGYIPQTVLGLVLDRVREVIDSNTELVYLQRTCARAFSKYTKSKPSPSRASIQRVKNLPHVGVHPMFKGVLCGNELRALAFADQLKSFRPRRTILEVEGEAAKSKHLNGPSSQWANVMKKKRAIHDKTISLVHKLHSRNDETKEVDSQNFPIKKDGKQETCGSKRKAESFKDEEYFINYLPAAKHHTEAGLSVRSDQDSIANRLDSAVMDLVADDGAGIQKRKSMHHWDKKRKKYIKLNNGERVSANGKVKNESGKRVKRTDANIYEKWKEQSHRRIVVKGTDNARDAEGTARLTDRVATKFKRGNKHGSVPNADVASEIKNLEQIRKGRQKNAARLSFIKSNSNSNRGNKHHKNGGKFRRKNER